jgi:hypothetical protein
MLSRGGEKEKIPGNDENRVSLFAPWFIQWEMYFSREESSFFEK